MKPWIGRDYCKSGDRLAIVSESHYIPDNATDINKDPGCRWYESCQENLPIHLINYINTHHCVQNRQESGDPTYKEIEKLVSFCDVAFFNYIFRPTDKSAGYSNSRFKIGDKDKEVSASIMRWFIHQYRPKNIVLASSIILDWSCVRAVMLDYPEINTLETHHPISRKEKFSADIKAFLKR